MEETKPPRNMSEYYRRLADIAREREPQIEAERKKAEREFRAKCSKDTAGALIEFLALNRTQVESLQAQIDTIYPIGALARTVDAVVAKVTDIDRRLAALEKRLEARK